MRNAGGSNTVTAALVPDLVARRLVRSELTYHPVALDRECSSINPPPDAAWERFFAQRISDAIA